MITSNEILFITHLIIYNSTEFSIIIIIIFKLQHVYPLDNFCIEIAASLWQLLQALLTL